MFLFLTVIARTPSSSMNYPVKITDQNRAAVYALARELLPALKAATLLTLLGVEWAMIDAAARGAVGPLFMIAVFAPVALIIGTLVFYTFKMRAA
jgi:hypothetical protein